MPNFKKDTRGFRMKGFSPFTKKESPYYKMDEGKTKDVPDKKGGMYEEYQKLSKKINLTPQEKARKKQIEDIFDRESQYSERN